MYSFDLGCKLCVTWHTDHQVSCVMCCNKLKCLNSVHLNSMGIPLFSAASKLDNWTVDKVARKMNLYINKRENIEWLEGYIVEHRCTVVDYILFCNMSIIFCFFVK